jgi:hypothetical protein
MPNNATNMALPQPTEVNDSIDKRQIGEERGDEDGNAFEEIASESEDPWWRTFKLWKVNMRGLSDENTS